MPVGLINKDGSKVSDNVDDTKHETVGRKHGQVGAAVVSRNWTAGVFAWSKESDARSLVAVPLFAKALVERNRLVKERVDLVARVHLDVNQKDHCDQDSKDDDCVDVTGQKGSLETARGSVQNDTPRNQKRRETVVKTSQGFDSGRTTEQKHGRHNNIGAEAKEEERNVRGLAPTSHDNLGDGVGRRSDLLEVDGQDSKQEHLNGGTRGIPEGQVEQSLERE